jgi:hypothetical protein
VDFKLKLVRREKDHFILIKGAIHQEEITIINLYAPNVSAPNFIKHTLQDLKAYIDLNTMVVRVINIPLSPVDSSSRPKKKKSTEKS